MTIILVQVLPLKSVFNQQGITMYCWTTAVRSASHFIFVMPLCEFELSNDASFLGTVTSFLQLNFLKQKPSEMVTLQIKANQK